MNKQEEMAEAMIVVGPFLWKCVNCDILMSRQHSIDYHLFHSHYSKLYPSAISELEEMTLNCLISKCSCHKVSHRNNHKRKLQSHRNSHNSTKKKVKRSADNEQSGDSLEGSTENNGTEHYNEDSMAISTHIIEKPLESGGDLELSEQVNEEVSTLDNHSSPTPNVEQMDIPVSDLILLNSVLVPVSCEPVEATNTSEVITVSSASDLSGLDSASGVFEGVKNEENLPVLSSENAENSATDGDSIDVLDKDIASVTSGVEEGNANVRKSRRSTKGRSSLFKEFEMAIS